MFKNKLLVAALASAFAMPVFAEDAPTSTITPNIGVVSNYVYRGITQTSHKPALQGGVDYAHPSGFYAGLWGSNVKWIKDSGALASGDAGIELDTYLGFKNPINDSVSYDVGLIRYNYLGDYQPAQGFNTPGTEEVYGAVTYKWITLKYSYGLLDGFLTIPGAKGTDYLDLSTSYTLETYGVTLGAHVGKQAFKGVSEDAYVSAGTPLSYNDYKLSVSKDFSGYVVGLAHTWTNASTAWVYTIADPSLGDFWGKHVTALSVTKAF
jgi:uncharacterized protein (TIGR02001 family)